MQETEPHSCCGWLVGTDIRARRQTCLRRRRIAGLRLRILLDGRQAEAGAHVSDRRRGQAHAYGFHRRRGAVAGRPHDLCRGPVSRCHSRHQSAVRARDREVRDRPPTLPHPFSPGRQVVSSLPAGPMASLYHHDADNGEKLDVVRLGQHPTDMVWRARKADENGEEQAQWTGRLFVAAANTNNVYVVGVIRERRTCRWSRPSTSR